ncbi:uncharacterized protein CCR75_006556 [Bremia lactucae]|uniref:Uncharacterized protein n=1 Tax=Bremia lactucae TaxID=4779 RepID=A0A976ID93_BRELC|nr:hypothetical protein CCR75_006556 [Bremia lactucae]
MCETCLDSSLSRSDGRDQISLVSLSTKNLPPLILSLTMLTLLWLQNALRDAFLDCGKVRDSGAAESSKIAHVCQLRMISDSVGGERPLSSRIGHFQVPPSRSRKGQKLERVELRYDIAARTGF